MKSDWPLSQQPVKDVVGQLPLVTAEGEILVIDNPATGQVTFNELAPVTKRPCARHKKKSDNGCYVAKTVRSC